MLINNESSVCAFLLIASCLIFLVIIFTYHLFYCTCWVPTISVLNIAIFPYYSNLLLRRRRWTKILQRGVLGYVLPRLPFMWCYGVFRYSVLWRVILVFKDIICEHFWSYVWNNWSWVMHTMCTRFWHKNRVWHVALESGVRRHYVGDGGLQGKGKAPAAASRQRKQLHRKGKAPAAASRWRRLQGKEKPSGSSRRSRSGGRRRGRWRPVAVGKGAVVTEWSGSDGRRRARSS
jgi:hypothetical protein